MEATAYLNSLDPKPEYVVSDQDVPHRFNMSFIYELPFGRGRRFLGNSSRLVEILAGGWQINGIHTRQQGAPLGFGNFLIYGSVKDIPLARGERTVDRWFNTSVFERLNTKALVSNVRTASLRFSGVRAPGMVNYDLSMLKRTKITEKINSEFRGEFLNATNTPLFAGPNTDQYSTAFGTITAGRGYARRVQLGIRIIY
jgi:hypothetical protein